MPATADATTELSQGLPRMHDAANQGDAMLPSPEEDRAALIAAIEGEHAAFMRKDYAAWANHWLQVPSACHWGWVPTQGAYFMAGWQEISAAVKGWLDIHRNPRSKRPSTAIASFM
jgi:hypothetical protein